MTDTAQKVAITPSEAIPFNKLVPSESNVRRVHTGISIEDLANDIARRGLLQSLSVRPVLNKAGIETGMYEIPAGGRRYRALELLVKQKRLPKTTPIPCIVRTSGDAEEDSLAENLQRASLHPLDQYRAFLALREKGQSEDEIAATFLVSVHTVRQRLRLASVSPLLLEAYANDDIDLEDLQAFSISADHAQQEQVYQTLKERAGGLAPYQIRRMLTDNTVSTNDRRVKFVGVDTYLKAGGTLRQDLFSEENEGHLENTVLLEQLISERLRREADAVSSEGWKWVETSPDFDHSRIMGLRRIDATPAPVTDDEHAFSEKAQQEIEELEQQYADDDEDAIPERVRRRLEELEDQVDAIHDRPDVFDPAEIPHAGAFVSVDYNGNLVVRRGYIRREDQPKPSTNSDGSTPKDAGDHTASPDTSSESSQDEEPETGGLSPLSETLVTDLSVHHTLALRNALGEQPDSAFVAALHALAAGAFYHHGAHSCLELRSTITNPGHYTKTPGLAETPTAQAIEQRHDTWQKALPMNPTYLWDTLLSWDSDKRHRLFAHIVSLSVNAVHQKHNPRKAELAHANVLSHHVQLDMVASGWKPTVDNYLGRLPKIRIIHAVREGAGEHFAQLIERLKKPEMAKEAERLLANTGWLPEPLRLTDIVTASTPNATVDVIAIHDETEIASGHSRSIG